MTKITIGSTIIGASGKKLTVDRVEGDTIYSGELEILTSAVVKVIPPPTSFKLRDRVQYIGNDFYLKTQYAGILEVWEISPINGYTCLKPDGRLTSWVEFEDLRDAIEGDLIHCGELKIATSAVVEVIPPTTGLQTGDRVCFVGNPKDWGIERGAILTIVEDCGEWVRTGTADRKTISVLRSDLEI